MGMAISIPIYFCQRWKNLSQALEKGLKSLIDSEFEQKPCSGKNQMHVGLMKNRAAVNVTHTHSNLHTRQKLQGKLYCISICINVVTVLLCNLRFCFTKDLNKAVAKLQCTSSYCSLNEVTEFTDNGGLGYVQYAQPHSLSLPLSQQW